MAYFEKFPKMNYDFSGTFSLEMQNIFKRISFTEKTLNDEGNFENYMVKEGKKPEQVADEFYGDPKWWWLVLLSNNIIDVENEWPKNNREIQNIFKNFLKGNSYYVFDNLDARENDIMIKFGLDGLTGYPGGIDIENYGVVDNYDSHHHRIDVKKIKGSFSEKDRFTIFRKNTITNEYDTIDGFGITACAPQYYGSTSCVEFVGPTDDVYGAGPFCSTAGSTWGVIQKKTTLGDSLHHFEFGGNLANPYAAYGSDPAYADGISGDFFSYSNMCGLTGTLLYNYITDQLPSSIKAIKVIDKLYDEQDKMKRIKLITPRLLRQISSDMTLLLSGEVPRGTVLTVKV
jgi:hypothetical protein|tara:strand:- start:9516 stop:10547 length:1032 start_codon:yes stop_codon:yes gene_type:complete